MADCQGADDNGEVCFAVTPTRHKWLHLVLRMAAQGNATAYHNFGDESADKTLKALCRNASHANCEAPVYKRFRQLALRP